MSEEFNRLDENGTNIDELFVNVRNAMKRHEQSQATLQNENKTLGDANASLHDTVNRLTDVNNRQQTMLNNFHRSLDEIKTLKIELNDAKRENTLLKNSSDTLIQSQQQQSVDKLTKYNSLLQIKIVELEKKILLQNQKMTKQDSSNHDKQASNLKRIKNPLVLENKLLKEQLTNFRNMHNQIISEIHLKYSLKKCNDSQEANIHYVPPTTIEHEEFEQNELQPLRVNVIDDDEEN